MTFEKGETGDPYHQQINAFPDANEYACLPCSF
jgi:hypothetical protein